MTEQPASQQNESFVEPSRDEIPAISRGHVAAMEASDDDAVWVIAGMHHVVLSTTGRRSGNEHKVALPFWPTRTASRSWWVRSPVRRSTRPGT